MCVWVSIKITNNYDNEESLNFHRSMPFFKVITAHFIVIFDSMTVISTNKNVLIFGEKISQILFNDWLQKMVERLR